MIAGDVHAWTVFVVADGDEPGILMIEPQSDEVVPALQGDYSVDRRFEVLI